VEQQPTVRLAGLLMSRLGREDKGKSEAYRDDHDRAKHPGDVAAVVI